MQRNSRWIGNLEHFARAVPNIPEAEIQRSIEGHTESPGQLACSTGIEPVWLRWSISKLINWWRRSSESRTGENPMSGSTRGLKETYSTWVSSRYLMDSGLAKPSANPPDGLRARGLYSTLLRHVETLRLYEVILNNQYFYSIDIWIKSVILCKGTSFLGAGQFDKKTISCDNLNINDFQTREN